jgi:hypothetical protein
MMVLSTYFLGISLEELSKPTENLCGLVDVISHNLPRRLQKNTPLVGCGNKEYI